MVLTYENVIITESVIVVLMEVFLALHFFFVFR